MQIYLKLEYGCDNIDASSQQLHFAVEYLDMKINVKYHIVVDALQTEWK